MLTFARVSDVSRTNIASKQTRQRLDRIREECYIPWEELNKLAKILVGRDINNVGEGDCRKVIKYMIDHQGELSERYRKVVLGW